jgi:Protein of unknown function (DUF3570)
MTRPNRSAPKLSTKSTAKNVTLPKRGMGSIVVAALALPGVWSAPAHAENAPEAGVISFKFLHYKEDKRDGFDYSQLKKNKHPLEVNSPSLYVMTPLGPSWAVEATGVYDALSGASPRWHSTGGASSMSDERKAVDVKVTHYRERSTYSFGFSHSSEHDYVSKALSAGLSLSSDDNNTTLNLGFGHSNDAIDPTEGGRNGDVFGKKKKTNEFMIGVTQAMSAWDIAQLNLTYSSGKGYYNDPYKFPDVRPDNRQQLALLARWNHHFEGDGSTLRGSYRIYHDNFRINAHTLQVEWVKKATPDLTFTPLLRLYSQSAASFYFDPVYDPVNGEPFPVGYDPANPNQLISLDQRLSAFGAVTLGLKAEYRINPAWSVDGKYEKYEQRGNWRIGGAGSPGLGPFGATFVQFGANYKF